MKIYIFRHAQKAHDFSINPDLTEEGHGQALRLLDRVLQGDVPTPTQLWTSPRKRAQNTFRPLAQHLKKSLQLDEDLLEQKNDETLSAFRERVQNVLNHALQLPEEVIFICSHYDWVIEAMQLVPSDTDLGASEFSHWQPCQYVGFEVREKLFHLLESKRIPL